MSQCVFLFFIGHSLTLISRAEVTQAKAVSGGLEKKMLHHQNI